MVDNFNTQNPPLPTLNTEQKPLDDQLRPYGPKKPEAGGTVDLTSAILKANNLSDLPDKAKGLSNIGAAPVGDIDGTISPTFASLRSRKPAYEGQRVYVACHTPSVGAYATKEGAGTFIGHLVAQADDGGYVASSGAAWHWVREKSIDDLYIGDFGGNPDGTDCQPAFQKYYNFMFGEYARMRTSGTKSGSVVSGGYSPYLVLRYGIGTYFQKPGEYNKSGSAAWSDEQKALNPSGFQAAAGIRIEGVETSFGRMMATRIISDKTDAPVFLLNHRRMTLRNIVWDGQQTTPRNVWHKTDNPTGTNLVQGATSVDDQVNYVSNKQPFITNQCPSGCYVKMENLQFNNTGGHGVYVLDTLDSKLNEIFSSNTAAPWIKTGWSDPAGIYTGVWDHSTSIEISNINCSTPMGPAMWLPRVAQGIMRNVWFEHGTVPFIIDNGQWDMSMVCIEDCKYNPIAWNCRFTILTLSVPTGNDIDTDSPTSGKWNGYLKNPDGSTITAWAEGTGQGNWLLANSHVIFNCPVVTRSQRGAMRFENNTDNTLWINIGSFQSTVNGSSWKIRLVGGVYYNTSTQQNMLNDKLLGETIIHLGRGAGATPKASFYNIGGGVVAAAPQHKTQQFNTTIPELWVPIRARVGECTVFVEQTGTIRKEAGTPSAFTPSGATQSANPGMNAIAGRVSINTNKAGFGANEDVVEITSRVTAGANGAVSTPATDAQLGNDPVYPNVVRYMRVSVGGRELAMPVYAWKPVFTTNNPATLSVAAGGTLTLAPVVTDAQSQQWQFSSDGTNFTNIASGGTAQTYTKVGVTAADAGQYRLAVRADNGSGGTGITSYGPVTVVTVT